MQICELEPKYDLEKISFNFSAYSDFVDLLMKITKKSQLRWFNDRIASWQDDHNPSYVDILTLNGIAFSFNTFSVDGTFNMNT